MKKSLLLVAAFFAAMTINAAVIELDLNSAVAIAYDNCSASPSVDNDVLTVSYSAGGWEWAGVEFPLNNLDVTSVDFEYKGVTQDWTGFIVYLRAEDGARWYDGADDFSMSHEDWFAKTGYFPTTKLWDSSDFALGEKPFIALGFMTNPMNPTTGTFALRNVKITVPGAETAIGQVSASAKAVKVIRDGQMMIIRDGKTFNAIGAEIK